MPVSLSAALKLRCAVSAPRTCLPPCVEVAWALRRGIVPGLCVRSPGARTARCLPGKPQTTGRHVACRARPHRDRRRSCGPAGHAPWGRLSTQGHPDTGGERSGHRMQGTGGLANGSVRDDASQIAGGPSRAAETSPPPGRTLEHPPGEQPGPLRPGPEPGDSGQRSGKSWSALTSAST